MVNVEAKKDGKGNIIISENSFEMLLACLENQKFVGEPPQNGDSLSVGEEEYWKGQEDIQNTIDEYNRECRKILHQKLIFELKEDGYFLTKRYEHQEETINWDWNDVLKVRKMFDENWTIERNVFSSESHLTISEDGKQNRPWTTEEVKNVEKIFKSNE